MWLEMVVISWWHSARGAPVLSCWAALSTLSTSQTIKPLSLSIHIRQHRNSSGLLASVICFFRSLLTARGHRWGSRGRATGKSRALPLGLAPSSAPQTEAHRRVDPLVDLWLRFFHLSWARHVNTWTLWLWAVYHPWPWAFQGLELHVYSLIVADIRGVLTLKFSVLSSVSSGSTCLDETF